MTPLKPGMYCHLLVATGDNPKNSYAKLAPNELYYIGAAVNYTETHWLKIINWHLTAGKRLTEREARVSVPVYTKGVSFPTAMQLAGHP